MYLNRSRRIRLGRSRLSPVSWGTLKEQRELTLEVAGLMLSVARECDLRDLLLELIPDFPIRDVAHLMILFHHPEFFITDAPFPIWHEGITCLVRRADITVYAFPSLITLALSFPSWRSVLPLCQRVAQRLRTVIPTEPSRT